jgi:TolB-like protein
MSESAIITDAAIGEQMNRILSSPGFKGSRVLSGFLEFVTQETLAGRQQELKEYNIGVQVLYKKMDFNPQIDSIVRIHAGRLRRALNEYYSTTGNQDSIRIDIPKGCYIPTFKALESTQKIEIPQKIVSGKSKPVVAILPFRNISRDGSRDFFADGLGEQLSSDLTRFQDIIVISYYSSRHIAGKTSDLLESSKLLGAKYLLTGSLQSDNKHLHIRIQLIVGETGEQLWTKSFERNNTASAIFEIQNEIVRSILTEIGGYYGAIYRDMMNIPHSDHVNGIEIYDAVFWYYHYQKIFTKEVLETTVNALKAAVKANPNYALAWAMLGELYLDDKALDFGNIENPLEEGLKCAMRAIKIDPACQHAYQALAWVHLFHHSREECLKAAEQCIHINPNASDYVGAMGFVMICAGEFDKGFVLLNDSIRHNPYGPWWYNTGFAFYFMHEKNYTQALYWSEKMDREDLLWDPLMKAAAFGHLDRSKEAGKNIGKLLQLLPDAADRIKDITESFLLSPELNNEIFEGLKKAGLRSSLNLSGIEHTMLCYSSDSPSTDLP